MTGMKEGAGEDPFSEDTDEEHAVSSNDESPSRDEGKDGTTRDSPSPTASASIPYIYRRDSVHDNRDRYPLFLQEETRNAERDAKREFEDKFQNTVSVTDIREALILAGLDNLDDVESHLEGWGYGIEFE